MKNLKAEITDGIDLTKTKAQFGNQPSFSSASSSSSLSNSNEPHKIKNEHMNNMINSYSKAGKLLRNCIKTLFIKFRLILWITNNCSTRYNE